MITEVDRAAGEFRKVAESNVEAARMEHEAAVLAVARHPGVVELLGRAGTTLRLRLLDGAPPADRASISVVVATTLADLHDIGVAHGALRAEHIVFDHGAPVLCSFGRGRTGVSPDGPEAAEDVRALATALLAASDEPREKRALAHALRTEVTARRLAHLLAAPSRCRRRRGAGPVVRSRRRAAGPAAIGEGRPGRRRPATVGVVVVVAAIVLAAAATASFSAAVGGGDGRPSTSPGGLVEVGAGRFRIGNAGDIVVLGRWQCRAALPALLQPQTGRVWVFDAWAPAGASRRARLVAQVPGARSLRVVPGASGCDRLAVTGPGAATTLDPSGLRP